MSANLNSIVDQSKKRVREEEKKNENVQKRRKIENAALFKEEISIQTYFSLSSVDLVNMTQIEIWKDFIKVLNKSIFPKDILVDDSNPYVIYVPPKIATMLKEMCYDKISVSKLTQQLKERQTQFIDILRCIKASSKKNVQEHKLLFKQLKKLIKKGVPNLTLAEPTGWTVAHIAVCFGRIDVLICIQEDLLPDRLEQYETLLRVETNKRKINPAGMNGAPYYEKSIRLLNETQLSLLKEKQLIVILEMLVACEEKSQCDALYEQAKQLIVGGVDPTLTEPTRNWAILHYAVYKEDLDFVESILRHASLEQRRILLHLETKKTKSTVLSIASSYNHKEIFSLLEMKRDEIFKEESAEIFNELKSLKRIKYKELLYRKIEKFIKDYGDPIVVSDNGWNFLHYAVHFNDIILARRIKENVTPEQYEILLCAKTKEKEVIPYEMAINRNEKGFNNEELCQLLKLQVDKNISQPSEQLGGKSSFFKPPMNMSMADLCSQLNECIAGLEVVFEIQPPISEKEQSHLSMPYFTKDEEKINEFIQLLKECSIEASINNRDLENPIMVQGVEDKEKFLSNKDKLTQFAKEYLSTLAIPSITI